MSEIIVVDKSRELPKLELLAKYIEKSKKPFLTEEGDKKILEQIRTKTSGEIQKSARDIFHALAEESAGKGIIICGNTMTLVISFNPPAGQTQMSTSEADQLNVLIWKPFIVKVFMGGEEMDSVCGNILSLDSGVVPQKKQFKFTVHLRQITRDGERINKFQATAWIPEGKPNDVFGDNIKLIGERLAFTDKDEEEMLILPKFFKEANFLCFAIMASTEKFLRTGTFNGRVYQKRNPCITETLLISHHTYLGKGKSWPKDLVIHDEKNNFFFVKELL